MESCRALGLCLFVLTRGPLLGLTLYISYEISPVNETDRAGLELGRASGAHSKPRGRQSFTKIKKKIKNLQIY